MTSPIPPLVAYYRVSTERQGQSGLGLDAQSAAVAAYARPAGAGGRVRGGGERPEGQPAQARRRLALCRQKRAVLVIAKLDRLARSVAFISNLMESGVEFVAVDMPQANRLTCTSSRPWRSMSGK